MRAHWVTAGLIVATQAIVLAHGQAPAIPAAQLVREVVFNELNDHARHGYWRYWIERRTPSGTTREDQVETAEGPVARLEESNGQPLDPEALQQEQARLDRFLHSPQEQSRQVKDYADDEKRIGRILALMPVAFLYEYLDAQDGCYRLRFRPNPDYPAHSLETRVLHAMSGEVWINARSKRLTRLEGRVGEDFDFGFGIIGRLYKGGWFRMVRTQVGPADWKTSELEMHVTIRALLVKTIAPETSETRGGFSAVPPGMKLAQATRLLEYPEAAQPVAASTAILPVAFPVHP